MNNIWKITVLSLLFSCCFLQNSAAEKNFRERFRICVALNDSNLAKSARASLEDTSEFTEEHFALLKKNGVNMVRIDVSNPDRFEKILLPMLKKYDMQVLILLGFAYFGYESETWSEDVLEKRIQAAVDFVKKHKSNPLILGFALRENTSKDKAKKLNDIYSSILKKVPGVKFYRINSDPEASDKLVSAESSIYGFLRHPFRRHSLEKDFVNPLQSLKSLREASFRAQMDANEKKDSYLLAISIGGRIVNADRFLKNPQYKDHEKQIRQYLRSKQFGWQTTKVGNRNISWAWMSYRPPENTIRAIIWSGILTGAKTVLFYSYSPVHDYNTLTPAETVIKLDKSNGKNYWEYNWFSLAGRPNMPNQNLIELSETMKGISAFSYLIGDMRKCRKTDALWLDTDNRESVFSSEFTLPDIKGRIAVLHNGTIGTVRSEITIDESGNLIGFIPEKKMLATEMKSVLPPNMHIYRLDTGKEVAVSSDKKASLDILPGGGILLFLGTEKDFAELTSRYTFPFERKKSSRKTDTPARKQKTQPPAASSSDWL